MKKRLSMNFVRFVRRDQGLIYQKMMCLKKLEGEGRVKHERASPQADREGRHMAPASLLLLEKQPSAGEVGQETDKQTRKATWQPRDAQ
jgi:hypothetical protein